MGLSIYLSNKILKLNFSETLAKYDSNNDGFSQQEFSQGLKNITSIFARNIIRITGYDKKLFSEINADRNEVITYDELADYIKKEYNLDFNKISKMTFREICEEVDLMKDAEKQN